MIPISEKQKFLAGVNLTPDESLMKDTLRLIVRIEKLVVPSDSMVHTTVGEQLESISKGIHRGLYFKKLEELQEPKKNNKDRKVNMPPLSKRVDWDLLSSDVAKAISNGVSDFVVPDKVRDEIYTERCIQEEKMEKEIKSERLKRLQLRNNQPIFPGKWRRTPFGKRTYEKLTEYHITETIPAEEQQEMRDLLNTSLDGFVGQSYNYDDHSLTQDWMSNFLDPSASGPSEDNIIRTQLEGLIEIMMVQVQDRVNTENGVLVREPLGLGPDLKEVPVWGIDSYTRRMIEIALEDKIPATRRSASQVKRFIERKILPAINDQEPDKAYNMYNSLDTIFKAESSSDLDREYATAVTAAVNEYGLESFRIHPKGTGVICTNPNGIPPHVFITEYLGELYPAHRWCERLDVVEQAQKAFELKPTLPDFYNILLERPRQDPAGYGLMYVDASQKANMGSSCSHSCESNCTSAVVARNGKLVIALTTNRHVYFGEELTMDYYSITFSDLEWRAAICLCGKTSCRGSFLHYATQDDLQQVLNQNCGPLWRYASLLRSCTPSALSKADHAVLARHGMQSAALGSNPPLWMQKYAVDNLKFVEYERKGLPCALLRAKDNAPSLYTFSEADMDARTVMEQRIQSLVCCFSMVSQVLLKNQQTQQRQLGPDSAEDYPLRVHTTSEAVKFVWERLVVIPALLEEFVIRAVAEPTAAKSKKKGTSGAKKSAVPAAVSATVEAAAGSLSEQPEMVKLETKLEVTKDQAKANKLTQAMLEAIAAIRQILSEPTKTLAGVTTACLEMRKVLLNVEDQSNAKARLGQLADVLVFWAYTSNYSYAQEYAEVESGPVTVYARELGNNIPRGKFDKSGKNGSSSSSSSGSSSRKSRTSSGGKTLPSAVSMTSMTSEGDCTTVATEGSCVTDSPTGVMAERSVPMEVVTEAVARGESSVDDLTCAVSTSDSALSVVSGLTAEMSAPTSPPPHQKLTKQDMFYYSPNEPVFDGTMKFPKLFTFWQLMGWYKAGTDEKCESPDIFGCVQLPDPACCFGVSELPYGPKQRDLLVAQLKDDKSQMMPWPAALQKSFSAPSTKLRPLYGSPMLDSALGKVGAAVKVLHTLTGKSGENGKKYRDLSASKTSIAKSEAAAQELFAQTYQPDNLLPPESNTSWIQCDLCKKWRRLAWNVDADSLPDQWDCSMNSWDPDSAFCTVPQDAYDADRENIISYKARDAQLPTDFVIGSWRDVFCIHNKIYYEAQIVRVKEPLTATPANPSTPKRGGKKKKGGSSKPVEKTKVLFHFKGWSSSFDEWIDADSERINVHNLFTDPSATSARDQEKWQGVTGIKATFKKSGFRAAVGMKRKSTSALPVATDPKAPEESAVTDISATCVAEDDANVAEGNKRRRMKSI